MRHLVGRDGTARFELMEKMKNQASIDQLAETLDVSKSGFHAHRIKPLRARWQQDRILRPLIDKSFQDSRQTYGSPRVQLDLRDLGHRCGKNRITRLMREAGLRPKQKRRFRPCSTDSRHTHRIAPNWLARVPAPERPGQIWQSDITCIATAEGWLFLAFTLDAASRRCRAHHCREDMTTQLTLATFRHAMGRHPAFAPGLIRHSDRGSQYAADAFSGQLAACGVTASMSAKGNPYDNALAESFVATLKTECFGDVTPPTRAAARLMIFDYIETFYNTRRRHSALAYRSPAQFEKDLEAPLREGCSGGGSKGGETCPQSRSALAAFAVNNSAGCGGGVVQDAGNNPAHPPKTFTPKTKTTNLN
jgi:putative transposase